MPHAHVRGRVAIGVAALSALSVLGTTAPLAGLTGLVAPASAASAAATADDTADIADRIKAIPGVSSVTEAAAPAGYRFFKITFTQPVDHKDPSKGTFEQRLTLLHKDTSRPMVMYTGGYYVSQSPSRSEPTQIVDGNQLSMEYRFFEPSRPSNPDWEKELTIWQAATDQHRIIEAFKSVYDQHWITTGGSKGGMTATYHRRFYPDDVNGTVPYVAPNDVKDDKDAYNAWLAGVGSDQGCRDTLIGLERRVLGRDREWFSQKVADVSAANGYTYVWVNESSPETVNVWHNGKMIVSGAPANTGIPGAETELGTHNVYLRYEETTMSGENPDGSHYSDPGIMWVSYFYGGDALHAFDRASYGSPQSLGCVEMPLEEAGEIWPYTPIGTPVTVNPA